jgi:ABC-type uncharacterized transport system permease subunit
MTHPFLATAIVGYTLGIVMASLATVYRSLLARRIASIAFVLTWVAHLAAVVRASIEAGGIPLSSMGEYLLMLGWIVMTLHLYVWFRHRVYVAGLVLPPIAALSAIGAMQSLSDDPARGASGQGPWFLFHTTVATLGMAILSLAFAMSVIYLIQDRALKSKKTLRLIERLPSLEKADHVGHQALIVGFILLTLGIGTGVIINSNYHAQLWVPGPKQIFPLLAWIVFAVILASRTALGFRGRKSAYLTIAGFALGLLTILGMTL